MEPIERSHERVDCCNGIEYVTYELQFLSHISVAEPEVVGQLQSKGNVQNDVAEGMVKAPESGKDLPRTVHQDFDVTDHLAKGEEEYEYMIVVDWLSTGYWCHCGRYKHSYKVYVNVCINPEAVCRDIKHHICAI